MILLEYKTQLALVTSDHSLPYLACVAVTMTTLNPLGIDIPSVFVSDVAGKALAENYLYTKGYVFQNFLIHLPTFLEMKHFTYYSITFVFSFYIMVNEAPFDINTQLLLPFAIVVAVCLIIIMGLLV